MFTTAKRIFYYFKNIDCTKRSYWNVFYKLLQNGRDRENSHVKFCINMFSFDLNIQHPQTADPGDEVVLYKSQ